MTIAVEIVSDPSRLSEIGDICDRLVQRHSENPFLLAAFIEQYMERARILGWTPLVLLISVDQTVVGIVPLMTRKKFGIRQARMLPPFYFSDFVCADAYREAVASETISILFSRLHCQLVSFVFRTESPFLKLIECECSKRGIRLCYSTSLHGPWTGDGAAILHLRGSWDEFVKSKGKKFRGDIRRTERYLSAVGQWRIVHLGQGPDEQREALYRMTHVDRMSWKWFDRNNQIKREHISKEQSAQFWDDLMLIVWRASLQSSARNTSSVTWYFYFLQLDRQSIAYVFVVEFNGIIFPVFTSYDREYSRFGPSIYLINMLIRDALERGAVTKIDFLTDLPFMRTWTSVSVNRVTLIMAPHRGLTAVIPLLYPRGIRRVYESITSLTIRFPIIMKRWFR